MTKQEMAEWLAENVLGAEVEDKYECVKYIYSPEGFFAVLAGIRTRRKYPKLREAWSTFLFNQNYEAFYNAVHEAMKGEKE